jgi:hypothetical protein
MRRSLFLVAAGVLGAGFSHERAEARPLNDVHFTSGSEAAIIRRGPDLPWRKLESKTVPEGAEIGCEQTCQLKVDPDNELTLSAGAVLTVGAIFYVPLVSTTSLVPAHEIRLKEGHIVAHSPNEKGLPLVVSGVGTTHVALRAAEVQIAAKGERLIAQVNEGTARGGSNKRWITIEKAQAATLAASAYPVNPRAEIAPPEWKVGQGCASALGIAPPGNASNIGVCWEPRANAASYLIEVARDEAFTNIEDSQITTSTTWTKTLPEGRYFARTRAIDSDTMVSRTSAPRKLGVVSFTLPPGASADLGARTVVLPQGRAFQLRDMSGIESAVDRGVFVTIRGPVVMDAESSHVFRFRLAGDPSSESSIELQRRALRADIDIGPKSARWPVDPVDITVTVRDPAGLVDATQVTPKLRVLLGLTELPVSWNHRGPVWTTRLAPRNVGPTVIRVLAEDEFGNPIGRTFLEVDEKPSKPGEPSSSRHIATN